MTLTDNTLRISELAGLVLSFADARSYEQAHCALDDIETKCRKLHRHIDQLQATLPRPVGPAGEVTV